VFVLTYAELGRNSGIS